MTEFKPTKPVPQFGTAEYPAAPAGDSCKVCKAPITGTYYRANGAMLCGSCADRLQRELPQDSHGAFVRATLFGLAGFAVGLTLYAAFVILTGISIGLASLPVGWIVGKAMVLGSKGIGGRRYQITAVVLTYAAVSMAFIPIAFSILRKEKAQAPPSQIQIQQDATASGQGSTPPASASNQAGQRQSETKQRMGLFTVLGKLALIGLASPFLELEEGFNGVIGLVILFVGMQFAWKMTAGRPAITVEGPYQAGAPG